MIDQEYGIVRLNLSEIIKSKNLSKNKLAHMAEMQRSQLNSYCDNSVSRYDVAVLGRLCTVLNCKIEDLLKFIPPDQKKQDQTNV